MQIDWQAVRDLIEAGWCRGEYHNEYQGKHYYCLLGAIAQTQAPGNIIKWLGSQNADVVPAELVKAFHDLNLPINRKYFMNAVSEYNDNPDTTQQDILALLDRTIEYANRA